MATVAWHRRRGPEKGEEGGRGQGGGGVVLVGHLIGGGSHRHGLVELVPQRQRQTQVLLLLSRAAGCCCGIAARPMLGSLAAAFSRARMDTMRRTSSGDGWEGAGARLTTATLTQCITFPVHDSARTFESMAHPQLARRPSQPASWRGAGARARTHLKSHGRVRQHGNSADGRLALSPGPYALIFALMVPFCFDVPVSTRFTIFSLKLSDKSFVYLAGLQMLLSAGKSSIIPGAAGILAGFLYRSNVLHVRSLKFPDALAESAARLFAPLMSRPPAAPATRPGGARAAVDPGHHRVPAANRYAPSAPPLAPPLPPPSEADVATLEAMGFDREAALRALSQARGDLNLATNLLLESQIM
eukprot:jgi/Mesen1/10127/ME000075S09638